MMLTEIHLSQIRISDSKREKVCAVCPYLSFCFLFVEIEGEEVALMRVKMIKIMIDVALSAI